MEISKEELVVCIERARERNWMAVLRTKTITAIFMKTA